MNLKREKADQASKNTFSTTYDHLFLFILSNFISIFSLTLFFLQIFKGTYQPSWYALMISSKNLILTLFSLARLFPVLNLLAPNESRKADV